MMAHLTGTEGFVELAPMLGAVFASVAPMRSGVLLSTSIVGEQRNCCNCRTEDREPSNPRDSHGACSLTRPGLHVRLMRTGRSDSNKQHIVAVRTTSFARTHKQTAADMLVIVERGSRHRKALVAFGMDRCGRYSRRKCGACPIPRRAQHSSS